MAGKRDQRLWEGLAPAATGYGPLLQRDYWAIIDRCVLPPSRVIAEVKRKFAAFAPEELARFRHPRRSGAPLQVGDEMEVHIRGSGRHAVRVVHADRTSFTLATIAGHPEAGRITFGAYRNAREDVLFHIRSRARFRTSWLGLGFQLGGDAMQTNTWTAFVNRVANACGQGVIGYVHAETLRLARDRLYEDPRAPTFLARGD